MVDDVRQTGTICAVAVVKGVVPWFFFHKSVLMRVFSSICALNLKPSKTAPQCIDQKNFESSLKATEKEDN